MLVLIHPVLNKLITILLCYVILAVTEVYLTGIFSARGFYFIVTYMQFHVLGRITLLDKKIDNS